MPETPSPTASTTGSTAPAPRPAPQAARLVQFSCQRLLAVEPDFAEAFHSAVCELAPELALPTLPAARELSGGVAHCVLWAALTQDDAASVVRTVEGFAADHHGRGFPDDAYATICHALLRAVRAVLPTGWSSELSSSWVSYALWLQPHLRAGAGSAAEPGRATAVTADAMSLDLVLDDLRSRYFPADGRALDAVCTRLMLRTGADLRAPRLEQRHDPVLIAEVMNSLLLMGYAPGPAVTAAATDRGTAAREALRAAGDGRVTVASDGRAAGPPVDGRGPGRRSAPQSGGSAGRSWWHRRARSG
jgi:hemoglobin-like flavoprotein